MALIAGCQHELEFTIPAHEVEKESERIAQSYTEKVRLPGFRPGKAPKGIVRQKFAAEIRQETLESLIPKQLLARFKAEQIKTVGQPEVVDLKYIDGADVVFKARFEVVPEFELGEYRNVEVIYNEPVVDDEELDKRIEEIREEKAQFVNDDPRPAKEGDFAVVDLESVEGVDGDPVSSKDLQLEIGATSTMSEFTSAITGLEPGSSTRVTVDYPEDYSHEKLAGKKVVFEIKLNQLRRKELPELNDDFAKDLGDFQSFEELRNAVRTQLLRSKESSAQEGSKRMLMDKLVDAHDFSVPNAWIDRQIQIDVENYLQMVKENGGDPSQMNLDWAKIREARQETAARQVKGSVLLDRIATAEAIDATQDDLDREIQRVARERREPPIAVRQRWEKDGVMQNVASQIRDWKTRNFLFDNARKVAGEMPVDPAEAVEAAAE
ncbi:MAG: trigger factor [Bryobacteraceae bacterium]|nr:trigger factor [Bryobacteraceae bacterium]